MIYEPNLFDTEKDLEMFFRAFDMKWPEHFGEYSRFYNIATESIKDYIGYLPCLNGNALTIGASGDQAIALVKNGAKNIYYFDINKADYYFVELKKCAFLNLKRKEFLDFLIAEQGQTILNYNLYKKISEKLPKPVKFFWDNIYGYFGCNNKKMAYYLFRSPIEHSSRSRIINDYYINNEVYYDTKSKLEDTRWFFIPSDLYKLEKNLPRDIQYDAIILSNIYEYLNFGDTVSIKNAKKYVEFIKNVLLPRLNNNGSIMSAYLCKYNDEVDEFIKESLGADPEGWAPSSSLLQGLDYLEKYLTGYTGQNVSYHYLLDEMAEEVPFTKVYTQHSGYGMSSSNNDLALILKK